jgi:hypothetical protein
MKLPSPIGALVISSRGKLEMSSAGPRLLLKGFKKRLNAYDSFELTLYSKKQGGCQSKSWLRRRKLASIASTISTDRLQGSVSFRHFSSVPYSHMTALPW